MPVAGQEQILLDKKKKSTAAWPRVQCVVSDHTILGSNPSCYGLNMKGPSWAHILNA
jgi:hypothetical protein